MLAISSSDVRNEWSAVMDSVIRQRPAFIKRTRDRMVLCTTDTVAQLVEDLKFVADRFIEDDGSVTLSMETMDIVANGPDEKATVHVLAENIVEYAEEYYNEFEAYSYAPNRRPHFPYVMKALTARSIKEVEAAVVCRNGKI